MNRRNFFKALGLGTGLPTGDRQTQRGPLAALGGPPIGAIGELEAGGSVGQGLRRVPFEPLPGKGEQMGALGAPRFEAGWQA